MSSKAEESGTEWEQGRKYPPPNPLRETSGLVFVASLGAGGSLLQPGSCLCVVRGEAHISKGPRSSSRKRGWAVFLKGPPL